MFFLKKNADKPIDDLIISDLGVNKDNLKKKKDNHKDLKTRFITLKSKWGLKKVAVMVLVFIVFATVVFILKFINFNISLLVWKTNLTRSSETINNKSVEYKKFQNGILRVSNDGVTYIDDVGDIKWTVAYNVKDPLYVTNGEYFSVSDRSGNDFYIFDKKGLAGSGTTTNAIVKTSLSKEGVIYILQSDESSSYINVFRHTGMPIDIKIKNTIAEDGIPIDLCTSSDGEELVVCYVVLGDSKLTTKAVYYNFGNAGKLVEEKKIVGEFVEEFDNKFLARAYFFGDNKSCLIYDGGVYFVSTSDETNPKIIGKYDFGDRVKSISCNDRFIAMTFEGNKLITLDAKGTVICSKSIDFDYDNFYLDDNYVIFLDGNRTIINDIRGRVLFDKELEGGVSYVAKKKDLLFQELYVGLVDSIECIRFY